jgi:MFS family permease
MKNKIKLTLLLASMLTVLSGAIVAPALPEINKAFENVPNSDLLTKLIVTLPALFIAIFSPLAGFIIDKFAKLPYFKFSLVLYALSGCAGFIIEDIYLILVSRALLGIAVAGVMTTATTLAGDYFEDEERNKFLGNQGAFMAFGGTIFILISGLLADINWHYPFLVYGLSLVVVLLTYLFLNEPVTNKQRQYGNEKISFQSKEIVALIYFLVFLGMLLFYFVPVQIPFLINKIGIESSFYISLALVFSTLFAAIASFTYANLKKRLHFSSIFILSFTAIGTGYFILAQAQQYFVVISGLIIAGAGLGMLMPNANTWLIAITPSAKRGKLIGGVTATVFLGQFLSPIAANPIVQAGDLFVLFFTGAMVALALGISLLLLKVFKSRIILDVNR